MEEVGGEEEVLEFIVGSIFDNENDNSIQRFNVKKKNKKVVLSFGSREV